MEITPYEAAQLAADGLLPGQPERIERLCPYRGGDLPRAELADLRFLTHFDGQRVTGFLVFRDAHDLHAGRTMRSALHLAGSPRACLALGRHLADAARSEGLPLRGEVAVANVAQNRAYAKMGWTRERNVWVRP